MVIGIDAHMLGDHSGGNESFYEGILKALEPDKEDEYILFMNPGVDDTPYRERFRIVRFKSENAFIRNFIELGTLCRKYGLDLLHTQYYIPFIRPCKTVVTIHDISFEHFKEFFKRSEYYRNRILIPYAARKSDAIVTVSEFSKDDISARYHVDKTKLNVIYNAVSDEFRVLSEEELKQADVRSRFGIGDADYLICVGNLQPRKNIPRLVEAYQRFRQRCGQDTKLVIVGKKAWLYDDALKEIKKDTGSIVMTDYVERKDLVALLCEAKGFIYPSLFEGFGIPPLEAISCGTGVAVSDIPVMHEVTGDRAMFFDPYDIDSISKSIEKLMLRQSLDETDEARPGLKLSWQLSADKLKKLYKEVLR